MSTNPTDSVCLEPTEGNPFLLVPGVLYCVVDSRGSLIEASPAWRKILGYNHEDLMAMNLLDLVHPEDLERTLGDEPWLDRPSAVDGYTNRCRHKDGSYRWVLWHTQHRPDLQSTYVVGVDITNSTDAGGRKPSVIPRGATKSSDNILFEANPNPMWVYDRSTLRFLEVNDATIERYGYSRTEFLMMTLLEIRPSEDREAVLESVRNHNPYGGPMVWTHLTKAGYPIRVEVLVRNIEFQGYQARLASIKDITEQENSRRLLEETNEVLEQRVAERTHQLVAANTELEAFCFSVSHDLRGPLRAIDGFSHSILKSFGDEIGPDARHDLQRVRLASKRMSELIDALLSLARLTRQELHCQELDLSSIARSIASEMEMEWPTRKVHVRIQPGMTAYADPRLAQILIQNLFSNAWKFTSKQPMAEIVFEARQSAGELVYSIRDNGAGFDMSYGDKLFQPFQRLHHESEFPGNGVGLATVNRIVTRHGGRAFAQGLVHHGATIYFTLPGSKLG